MPNPFEKTQTVDSVLDTYGFPRDSAFLEEVKVRIQAALDKGVTEFRIAECHGTNIPQFEKQRRIEEVGLQPGEEEMGYWSEEMPGDFGAGGEEFSESPEYVLVAKKPFEDEGAGI